MPVKTRERFMGIGQLRTMPIFFASNAIYPISIMPAWLRTVSSFNPLTYEVDGLRAIMLAGGRANMAVFSISQFLSQSSSRSLASRRGSIPGSRSSRRQRLDFLPGSKLPERHESEAKKSPPTKKLDWSIDRSQGSFL
jgi:hypothetical protein